MSVQQQERAMRTVLEGIVRRDDETRIRAMYRQVRALKDNCPSGLEDDEFDKWTDAADGRERTIARFHAEDFGDIEAKLAVLIDRLRHFMEDNEAGAFDLILAMSARDDLRRLTEQSARADPKPAMPEAASDHIGRLEFALVDLSNGLKDLGPAIQDIADTHPQADISRLNFVEKGLREILTTLEEVQNDLREANRGRPQP